MKQIGERLSFKDHGSYTTIVILPKSEAWKNAFLLAWILAWTFIGGYFLYLFSTNQFDSDQKLFFSVVMLFWFYFEYRAIKALLWIKFGREMIKIDQDRFTYKKSVLSYGKAKSFFIENIKKFREIPKTGNRFVQAFENSYWEMGRERLEFESVSSKLKFAQNLEEKETTMLFKIIEKRFNSALKKKK